jgi:hypothetical protein
MNTHIARKLATLGGTPPSPKPPNLKTIKIDCPISLFSIDKTKN